MHFLNAKSCCGKLRITPELVTQALQQLGFEHYLPALRNTSQSSPSSVRSRPCLETREHNPRMQSSCYGKQTVTAEHVTQALQQLGFQHYLPALQEHLTELAKQRAFQTAILALDHTPKSIEHAQTCLLCQADHYTRACDPGPATIGFRVQSKLEHQSKQRASQALPSIVAQYPHSPAPRSYGDTQKTRSCSLACPST